MFGEDIGNGLILGIIEVTGKYYGTRCNSDRFCRKNGENLLCINRECQCKPSWRLVSGVCLPPEKETDPPKESNNYEVISVLMPTFIFGAFILILSICACMHIHQGT